MREHPRLFPQSRRKCVGHLVPDPHG
jgi:hypothetical protein